MQKCRIQRHRRHADMQIPSLEQRASSCPRVCVLMLAPCTFCRASDAKNVHATRQILRLHRAMAGLVRAATKVSVPMDPCESPTITEEDIFPPPPPDAAPSPAPTPPISRASTAAGHRGSLGQGVAAAAGAAVAALITPPVALPAATSTPSATPQDNGGGGGGSLYALGGWDGGSNSASVEVYDVNTHHWVPSR